MKGDVFFHSRFVFHDGQVGEKLFLVLNDPHKSDPYLVIKTTSKNPYQNLASGCHAPKKVFFVPKDEGLCFKIDTLLQVSEIYEFTIEQFLKGTLQERVISHIGTLPQVKIAQVINCLRQLKEDISEKHFKLITS